MFVTKLRTEGLRGAPPELVDLTRVVHLPPPPARCGIADALTLFAAGLAPRSPSLRALGWGPRVVPVVDEDDDDDVQFQGLDPHIIAGLLAPDARAITVEAVVHLDPPLFGELRAFAARDPRIVTALGQRPELSIKVGWLFNRDHSAVSPAILGVRVGDVAFETVGKERPPWLSGLLSGLAPRIGRTCPLEPVEAVVERLAEALVSPDAEIRSGYARVVDALQAPPFALPRLGIARFAGQLEVVFGDDPLRLRSMGRVAVDAMRLAEATLLRRPDVLVVDEGVAPSVADWLISLPEADDAPIEQVWLVPS